MVGLVVGMVRMVLDFVYPAPGCEEVDTRPGIVANVHYLYFGILLFVISMIVTIVVSLLTKPIPQKYVRLSLFFLCIFHKCYYNLQNESGR